MAPLGRAVQLADPVKERSRGVGRRLTSRGEESLDEAGLDAMDPDRLDLEALEGDDAGLDEAELLAKLFFVGNGRVWLATGSSFPRCWHRRVEQRKLHV